MSPEDEAGIKTHFKRSTWLEGFYGEGKIHFNKHLFLSQWRLLDLWLHCQLLLQMNFFPLPKNLLSHRLFHQSSLGFLTCTVAHVLPNNIMTCTAALHQGAAVSMPLQSPCHTRTRHNPQRQVDGEAPRTQELMWLVSWTKVHCSTHFFSINGSPNWLCHFMWHSMAS